MAEQETTDQADSVFESQQSFDPAMDEAAEAFFNREKASRSGASQDSQPDPGEAAGPEPSQGSEEGAEAEPVVESQASAEGEDPVYEDDDGNEDPSVEVVVNGERIEVPFSELVSGYSRTQDYTRKTTEVAEARRQLEEQAHYVSQEQAQSVQRMNQVTQQLEVELANYREDPRELDALRLQNPGEYAARIADQQRRSQLLSVAYQEQMKIDEQSRQQQIPRAVAELKAREAAFAESFDSTYEDVGRWVTDPAGGGLSVDEWNQVTDPRQILIAYKAMESDKQGQAKKAATPRIRRKLASLPKIRSGSPVEPGQNEQKAYQESLSAMQTDSSLDTIANAFLRRAEAKETR